MVTQNIVNGWTTSFTANNTGSITVNNIPSFVNTVLVTFTNLLGSSNSSPLIQFSTNNGSSFISSGYQGGLIYATGSQTSTGYQSATSGVMYSFISPTSGAQSGSFYIYGLNQSITPLVSGVTSIYNQASSSTSYGTLGGSLPGTTNANAFWLICSPGSILSGSFKIYGLY